MAAKKKLSPAAHGASAIKAIAAAEKAAVKAFADWGHTVEKAVTATDKMMTAAAKKTASIRKRSAKTLARVKKARSAPVKVVARDARRVVLAQLADANATLTTTRAALAATKAAQKLFHLVEKGMTSGMQAAEKAVAQAAKPKRRRRRRK